MKSKILFFVIALVILIMFTSCKKDISSEKTKSDVNSTSDNSELFDPDEMKGPNEIPQRTPNLEPMDPKN